MIGCRRAMEAAGRQVPLQVQVTMETTGRMLVGTEIGAAPSSSIAAMRPDVLGINCATGPAEMQEHLRYLSQHSPLPISVLPNAGLPSIVDGRTHYDLTPEQLAEFHRRHVAELGIGVVGGCCGTTPEHLRQVVEAVRDLAPARRDGRRRAERLVDLHPGDDRAGPQLPDHRRAHERQRLQGVPRRDARRRLGHVHARWPTSRSARAPTCSTSASTTSVATAPSTWTRSPSASPPRPASPLVLDSTEPPVLEAGLQHIGGRAILNSANLEDGELPGSRLDRVFTLAREYGAAVICLLIDERGQARDVEWKLEIAHRIHQIATERYGLTASATSSSTRSRSRCRPATTTCARTRCTRSRRSGGSRPRSPAPTPRSACRTSASASTRPPATCSTACSSTSASQAGLDSAIVHAGKIVPLNQIPDEQREVCLDLVYDRRTDTTTTRCSSCSRCSPT